METMATVIQIAGYCTQQTSLKTDLTYKTDDGVSTCLKLSVCCGPTSMVLVRHTVLHRTPDWKRPAVRLRHCLCNNTVLYKNLTTVTAKTYFNRQNTNITYRLH